MERRSWEGRSQEGRFWRAEFHLGQRRAKHARF